MRPVRELRDSRRSKPPMEMLSWTLNQPITIWFPPRVESERGKQHVAGAALHAVTRSASLVLNSQQGNRTFTAVSRRPTSSVQS